MLFIKWYKVILKANSKVKNRRYDFIKHKYQEV